MTPLDKPLKRALTIKGRDYVLTLGPEVLKITEKGRRLGLELKWEELVSGETALAVALHASLGKFQQTRSAPDKTPKAPRRAAKKSPQSPRKPRIKAATSSAAVSRAKWPASRT
jgi:hypothetical protein